MTMTFNHTIIAARRPHESARLFRELFKLPRRRPRAIHQPLTNITNGCRVFPAPVGQPVPY